MRGCSCRGTAGFAHVSCLAEQAKILFAEAEANNLDDKVKNERWLRWNNCGLCEQDHHGVVLCALGWACWKTNLGRPETDSVRIAAMTQLGNGLGASEHHEDALAVREAELAMLRRVGDSEHNILIALGNIAVTYNRLGRFEEALRLRREVYSGLLNLHGHQHFDTLREANNLATSLVNLKRFEEAKSLMRKMMPVARRALGENDETTLTTRWLYAVSLCRNVGATLEDLSEAVTALHETGQIARRVLGGAHPVTMEIERHLRKSREELSARNVSSISEAVGALGV